MDTSDSQIQFDENGVCEYCNNFEETIKPNWHTDDLGEEKLIKLSKSIKKDRGSKDFDCIIGLSGGLDSSYAAHIAVKKMNLKLSLIHI